LCGRPGLCKGITRAERSLLVVPHERIFSLYNSLPSSNNDISENSQNTGQLRFIQYLSKIKKLMIL